MAIKKNEMYTSLYAACDELRGGMDPSQYKNYILRLLFVKYVSDKFKDIPFAEIQIPEGGSYDDILKWRGHKNIGEEIDKVIARLADANDLHGIIAKDFHFNDETKLGSGKDMVDKLTKLVNIFNRPEFNFKNNKADGDDILGDAYEYLMRRFAVDSGKSKGQFYTPAEVSRILAKVVGIDEIVERAEDYTVYDPACGSGSLLIRAVNEAPFEIAPYGQELDEMTAGLAKMNLVLHNKATGEIAGNKSTFSHPQYFEEGSDEQVLRRFDFVVMNPPFSLKNWTNGYVDYGRCEGFGAMPPEKNGDFAWFLHVVKSLKRTGKAAIILPHGVLFRGNAEETIRKSIVDKGLIKAIISLPTNIFYGTGIPASIIVIDKEDADERDGIFMIDASRGFVKDGNKNRLREQDIYKIVTTYKRRITTDPTYARFVPNDENKIKNKYNLNISRYIDSAEKEDIQDIEAHLHGGIPCADVDSMDHFWALFPKLKHALFSEMREGYYKINVDIDEIRNIVYNDEDFVQYAEKIDSAFSAWKAEIDEKLRTIDEDIDIKQLIIELSEALVKAFEPLALISKYDVYEVLLSYWNETMADDVLVIKYDGYEAGRLAPDIIEKTIDKKTKEEKEKVVGWEGKLIPKALIESTFFGAERAEIDALRNELEAAQAMLSVWVEEQSSDDGILTGSDEDAEEGEEKAIKVTTKTLAVMIAEIQSHTESEEISALEEFFCVFVENSFKKKEVMAYIAKHPLCQKAINEKGSVSKSTITKAIIEARANTPVKEIYREDYEELIKAYAWADTIESTSKAVKAKEAELSKVVRAKYAQLTDEEIKDLLISKKWYATIADSIMALYVAASHTLTSRVTLLGKRYESTLAELTATTLDFESKVKSHLERMGFTW